MIRNYKKITFTAQEFKEKLRIDFELKDDCISFSKRNKLIFVYNYKENGEREEHIFNVTEFKELLDIQDLNLVNVYEDIDIKTMKPLFCIESVENGKVIKIE